jgi:hypothetical protein
MNRHKVSTQDSRGLFKAIHCYFNSLDRMRITTITVRQVAWQGFESSSSIFQILNVTCHIILNLNTCLTQWPTNTSKRSALVLVTADVKTAQYSLGHMDYMRGDVVRSTRESMGNPVVHTKKNTQC